MNIYLKLANGIINHILFNFDAIEFLIPHKLLQIIICSRLHELGLQILKRSVVPDAQIPCPFYAESREMKIY